MECFHTAQRSSQSATGRKNEKEETMKAPGFHTAQRSSPYATVVPEMPSAKGLALFPYRSAVFTVCN